MPPCSLHKHQPVFSSVLRVLAQAFAPSAGPLHLLVTAFEQMGKGLFFFSPKAKIIDCHHLSPVLAGPRRVRGQPEQGQGTALPAGLSQAAKRGSEAAGEQPPAKHGCIHAAGEEGASALRPSGDCGAAVAQSELGIGIRAGRAAMAATLPDYPAS